VPGLSPRQRELLSLLAEGYTLYAAARMMRISPATARHHRELALLKLDTVSTAHAIAVALRDGLIQFPRT
jgi:DNA-binding CsgD family transcriptional regulator